MRNDQSDALEKLSWLIPEWEMGCDCDEFYEGMQEWWELKVNKSDKEWQDLTYWEVANAAMGYLEYMYDKRRDEQEEKDMYLQWASER